MTVIDLTIEHAVRFAVPVTTQLGEHRGGGTLYVNGHPGGWVVSLVADGWATLFFDDADHAPFGRWVAWSSSGFARYATAQAAFESAFSTPQIVGLADQ